jgi:hypothetical protein
MSLCCDGTTSKPHKDTDDITDLYLLSFDSVLAPKEFESEKALFKHVRNVHGIDLRWSGGDTHGYDAYCMKDHGDGYDHRSFRSIEGICRHVENVHGI